MMADTKDTKERILDAAERIFAEHGFDACSIREITAEASVNLASVHYHFGSKEGLIKAVWERCVGPITERRMDLLDEVEAAAGEDPPPLEAIFEALIRPRLCENLDPDQSEITRRLTSRMFADPSMHPIIGESYREYSERVTSIMRRALPDLPPEDLAWRIHLALGTVDSIGLPERLDAIAKNLGCVSSVDEQETLNQLVAFVVAGVKAPLPERISTVSPAPVSD
jgi:AcrR family transcriptional regulator